MYSSAVDNLTAAVRTGAVENPEKELIAERRDNVVISAFKQRNAKELETKRLRQLQDKENSKKLKEKRRRVTGNDFNRLLGES